MSKLQRFQPYFVIFFLTTLSVFSFLFYYTNGQNLLYADAISRLDIARKVIDNITPGVAQLGNVWLPLPQVLMLPLIWNTFMWHTGIAGAVMSMLSFIIGGIYIYKSAKIISNSFLGAILSLCLFAMNINILYLQTTAMSESLFICTLAATMYYFLRFVQSKNSVYLIPAALAVTAMTLTRYEGLAVLLSSIPMVYVITLLWQKRHTKAESYTLLYAVLACLGFTLWTIYLTAIFGDPLYWKNYYATAQATGGSNVKVYSQAKPFLAAIWQYFTSCVWMIGLVPMLFSLLGTVVMLIQAMRKRTVQFLPLLMPLSIFLFMVLTLQRNTPIVQPDLTWANILSSKTSYGTGFNIRYGILLLPWVAIMSAYAFSIRYSLLKIIVFSVFGIQLFTYFRPTYSVLYQIPAKIYAKPYASLVDWMKENYDGGYILISASSHEDQMFEMGFDYRTYIHEGTNKYWKESLDDPPRYAKWVVLDKGHDQDKVAAKKNIEVVLARDYNLVYDKEQVKIYKIKKKPYFEIK
jgi:hypothetical protein